MEAPVGSAPTNMPMPDFSKIKHLSPRGKIQYRENRGYELTIDSLPWGKEGSVGQPPRQTIFLRVLDLICDVPFGTWSLIA
jgi:hypothetical protein